MPKRRKTGHVSEPEVLPRVVPASEFKARCLELMDRIRQHGGEIVITKRGEPVAKLVQVGPKSHDIFGYLKGTVTYHGDIVAPTGERWNAEED